MGRYDFRPIQVLQHANRLIDTGRASTRPPWAQIIAEIPPGDTIVRPVKRFDAQVVGRKMRNRKSSRMFQPLKIVYPEDRMRTTFFNDHPWELARPRTVIENDGNDGKLWDWSRIEQSGKSLDGESVVRRQLYLVKQHARAMVEASAVMKELDRINSTGLATQAELDEISRVKMSLVSMTQEYETADFKSEEYDVLQMQMASEIEALDAKSAQLQTRLADLLAEGTALAPRIKAAQKLMSEYVDEQTTEERAYDQARKEFYALRLKEDVARQIVREEAAHYGSYFEPTANHKSLKHEDDAFEDWKEWALKDIEVYKNKNAAMFSGGGVEPEAHEGAATVEGGTETKALGV